MKYKQFSMLLTNNNRSKAYIQSLVKIGLLPEKVIFLEDSKVKLSENTESDAFFLKHTQKNIKCCIDADISFDEKEHVLVTLKENGISFECINTLNVNSEKVVECIRGLKATYVVYSGPGGTILRDEILSQGKKFIHVHPGVVPDYKGSTTIYYSMLLDKKVGSSVIFLEKKLDSGPLLYQKEFTITDLNIDLDRVLDPCIRARTLVDFLKVSDDTYANGESSKENVFFIIHPVLKHLSILSMRKCLNDRND